MKFKILSLLFVFALLASCSPEVTRIEAPTSSPSPTRTSTPAPLPTSTPTLKAGQVRLCGKVYSADQDLIDTVSGYDSEAWMRIESTDFKFKMSMIMVYQSGHIAEDKFCDIESDLIVSCMDQAASEFGDRSILKSANHCGFTLISETVVKAPRTPTHTPKPPARPSETLKVCGVRTTLSRDSLEGVLGMDGEFWKNLDQDVREFASTVIVHESGEMTESQVCEIDTQEFVDCFDVFAEGSPEGTLLSYGKNCGAFLKAYYYPDD